MEKAQAKLLRVGELAKAVGKTVRAMHLYEELGLLEPAARSEGGFRLYGQEAIDRIHWIVKLQAIGFTLADIQGFVADFRDAGSGRQATDRARTVFSAKLAQIREQMTQLQVIENDLHEALEYLDSCQACSTDFTPHECGVCGHHGHQPAKTPRLFAGLTRAELPRREAPEPPEFDVAVAALVSGPRDLPSQGDN
ncbi:MAG: MerR family DNA-binding protein [Kofleriaceae bacterium]|nr:MerR family DNA-binding protein [Kofleriaceae bacterium]MCL4227082.1 MerR family DNA-binding protein [Myxococcales bacterium]